MAVTRLFDLIPQQIAKYPKQDALATKENGTWISYSSVRVQEIIDKVSIGFIKSGLQKDDKVAIISPNRPEWNFIDLGLQQIGAVSVPIYPTLTVEDYRYIFDDAEVKMVFVYDEQLFAKATEAVNGSRTNPVIYTLQDVNGAKSWKDITALADGQPASMLDPYKANVFNDDLLTLIYTSGTTGKPKGVMLTHNNILSNVLAAIPLMPVNHNHKALSFLPLCHVYERMLCYLYLSQGVSIYYAESTDTVGENLKEVQPHMFVTVPRLLEKVYDKIVAKGAELTGIKKFLFYWALELGLKYDMQKNQGFFYNIQLKLANKIIFSKWREALGGNVITVVSGGAALQPRLARVFWAAQIPVMEGYGLTETSPVIAVNRFNPDETRISTVGPLLPGVEVKIAEDGEILTRGPHIMKGYYKRPDLTAEAIDSEGWFHTGDIGQFVENKYLKITDRKKEMFKTSGGKYIAPQLVENKFKESRYIEQIMVIGEGEKFPSAIVVPSFADVKSWCEIKGIPYTTNEEMVCNAQVIEKFQKEFDEMNENFAQYERVKKFILMPRPFTIESGEMTPTLKLKRKIIMQNCQGQIEKMYAR
ncbi:AMP-dependent synthetase/ligase [Cytophaga hutchinsonii]|uniref:Long-chain-fatty-acid--CoA ligase (Acyl-CoA synthetase) n=1 Tax=Cytophaga hutchinsonii (strain ATCC 33406 / DSM 1761 / CIP 103989 / NBRC 15051 / NCIMB 9469 / D465) TaxID=269798 RepID=A0A6N4SWI2_CYTH3|nr:long-chain fatty acid--CoA ligase [Cytophaga hutchinsonii]ABG60828.1 long-chain-fatty-acid--CoA ligase (acyl-CoA synthetase) [Cytophaga hutchinsonii ATCC 33406]SFX72746.1 long-chain acyl-CoA synthetase [Cytophaga hutchinsonii ATCC 33406]